MDRETKLDITEMTRGYLGALLLAIIIFSGVVSGITSGESYSFKTNFTNPVYTVVGNSSDLVGLNVTFENGNITISIPINYKPDNYTIIFFDNVSYEVIQYINSPSSGGSGSGRIVKTIDKNVTVYVPEYINQTVEVEKIIDNTKIDRITIWDIIVLFSVLIILSIITISIAFITYRYFRKTNGNKK